MHVVTVGYLTLSAGAWRLCLILGLLSNGYIDTYNYDFIIEIYKHVINYILKYTQHHAQFSENNSKNHVRQEFTETKRY